MSDFTKAKVRKWMRENVHDFEEHGEINCTHLAEAAADAFGQADENGPLDDPDHWIWELALEFDEIEEKKL